MPPIPADNCKIKVAVRVRPFNRRGKNLNFFYFALSSSESPSIPCEWINTEKKVFKLIKKNLEPKNRAVVNNKYQGVET